MELKEARERAETYRNAHKPGWGILTEAEVAIILDDRITELETQISNDTGYREQKKGYISMMAERNAYYADLEKAIIRIQELEAERLHLRTLIRGEQIKPPFDIEDDVTTELAVALADMEKQRDELVAVCKRAAARQPEALGKMEKHNIVLDDLNNIYQKAAFTFYSMLVQTNQEIEAVFEEQEIKAVVGGSNG